MITVIVSRSLRTNTREDVASIISSPSVCGVILVMGQHAVNAIGLN